ncbi:prevent-host-death protein [Trinickia violacea]|uniref:Prevent-host-death protein n=1 Tax=Trinickia violacea TaxID=2571746 RepID=A0A4P8IKC3_9BURK|nr:prevent-host-death protein [Trinickia violacea]QCP48271.1 prevent-host-death protein [Trinickia violacea]
MNVDIEVAAESLLTLVASLAEVREIVITQDGHPVARLMPVEARATKRIGIAKGLFEVPESIDTNNIETIRLFRGESAS